MADWARELGISTEAMWLRVNRCVKHGLDLSVAVSTPVDQTKAQNAKGS